MKKLLMILCIFFIICAFITFFLTIWSIDKEETERLAHTGFLFVAASWTCGFSHALFVVKP